MRVLSEVRSIELEYDFVWSNVMIGSWLVVTYWFVKIMGSRLWILLGMQRDDEYENMSTPLTRLV